MIVVNPPFSKSAREKRAICARVVPIVGDAFACMSHSDSGSRFCEANPGVWTTAPYVEARKLKSVNQDSTVARFAMKSLDRINR